MARRSPPRCILRPRGRRHGGPFCYYAVVNNMVGGYRPRGCAGGAGRRATRLTVFGEPSIPPGDLLVVEPRDTMAAPGRRSVLADDARAYGLPGHERGEPEGQGPNSVADPIVGRRYVAPSGPGESNARKVHFAPRGRRFRELSFDDEPVQERCRHGRCHLSGLPAGGRRGGRRSAYRRAR